MNRARKKFFRHTKNCFKLFITYTLVVVSFPQESLGRERENFASGASKNAIAVGNGGFTGQNITLSQNIDEAFRDATSEFERSGGTFKKFDRNSIQAQIGMLMFQEFTQKYDKQIDGLPELKKKLQLEEFEANARPSGHPMVWKDKRNGQLYFVAPSLGGKPVKLKPTADGVMTLPITQLGTKDYIQATQAYQNLGLKTQLTHAFVTKLPMEYLKFQMAMFAVQMSTCFGGAGNPIFSNALWEHKLEAHLVRVPTCYDDFFHHLTDPIGFFSFGFFILASGYTSGALNNIMVKIGELRKMDPDRLHRFARNPHVMRTFGYIGMAMGSMTSGFVDDLARNEFVRGCISNMDRHGLQSIQCSQAFDYFISRDKWDIVGAGTISLIGSAVLASLTTFVTARAATFPARLVSITAPGVYSIGTEVAIKGADSAKKLKAVKYLGTALTSSNVPGVVLKLSFEVGHFVLFLAWEEVLRDPTMRMWFQYTQGYWTNRDVLTDMIKELPKLEKNGWDLTRFSEPGCQDLFKGKTAEEIEFSIQNGQEDMVNCFGNNSFLSSLQDSVMEFRRYREKEALHEFNTYKFNWTTEFNGFYYPYEATRQTMNKIIEQRLSRDSSKYSIKVALPIRQQIKREVLPRLKADLARSKGKKGYPSTFVRKMIDAIENNEFGEALMLYTTDVGFKTFRGINGLSNLKLALNKMAYYFSPREITSPNQEAFFSNTIAKQSGPGSDEASSEQSFYDAMNELTKDHTEFGKGQQGQTNFDRLSFQLACGNRRGLETTSDQNDGYWVEFKNEDGKTSEFMPGSILYEDLRETDTCKYQGNRKIGTMMDFYMDRQQTPRTTDYRKALIPYSPTIELDSQAAPIPFKTVREISYMNILANSDVPLRPEIQASPEMWWMENVQNKAMTAYSEMMMKYRGFINKYFISSKKYRKRSHKPKDVVEASKFFTKTPGALDIEFSSDGFKHSLYELSQRGQLPDKFWGELGILGAKIPVPRLAAYVKWAWDDTESTDLDHELKGEIDKEDLSEFGVEVMAAVLNEKLSSTHFDESILAQVRLYLDVLESIFLSEASSSEERKKEFKKHKGKILEGFANVLLMLEYDKGIPRESYVRDIVDKFNAIALRDVAMDSFSAFQRKLAEIDAMGLAPAIRDAALATAVTPEEVEMIRNSPSIQTMALIALAGPDRDNPKLRPHLSHPALKELRALADKHFEKEQLEGERLRKLIFESAESEGVVINVKEDVESVMNDNALRDIFSLILQNKIFIRREYARTFQKAIDDLLLELAYLRRVAVNFRIGKPTKSSGPGILPTEDRRAKISNMGAGKNQSELDFLNANFMFYTMGTLDYKVYTMSMLVKFMEDLVQQEVKPYFFNEMQGQGLFPKPVTFTYEKLSDQ